jgi:tRNA(Ser,Leu) C12 N-acetylase TAN1
MGRAINFRGELMPLVLITVVFGKEEAAKLEVLDCLFPMDSEAKFMPQPYGGLLLLETSLDSDSAACVLRDCATCYVFKIVPVDVLVTTDLGTISSEALRLVGDGGSSVSVVCRRRGRVISSSSVVERQVGKALKGAGHAINLRKPDMVVRIDIIGERTTISVRPPDRFFTKMRGIGDERA